jgi:transcriptional regulator with XRE-family HTH domain
MHLRALVGRNIRRRREELDLTQEDVALSADIDLKYFGQIERGNRNPSLRKIEKIAVALETIDSDLFRVDQ